MGKDIKQDVTIQELKTSFKYLEEKFGAFQENMIDRLDKFDDKLDDMVGSFNQDKEHAKTYMDDRFVTKTEAKPVLTLYRRMTEFSLGIILFVGAAGIFFIITGWDFIKKRLGI